MPGYDLSELSDEELDALERTVAPRPQQTFIPPSPIRAQQAQAGIQAQQSNMQSDQVNRARTGQQMQQDAVMMDPRLRQAQAEATLKEQQARAAQAEAATKDPLNAGQIQAAEADAMSKLKTIDRIRKNHDGSWLPSIGMGAETVRDFMGGTAAADINADIGTLKAGGALTEVLKMTQETGKNPFTPMSNSDVELIARNTGNLDQAQSPDNFFANLDNYQNAYTNAYAGAVGKRTLNSEIERIAATLPPGERDAYRSRAIRLYNQRMASPPRKSSKQETGWYGVPKGAPRKAKQPSVINFEDWKD